MSSVVGPERSHAGDMNNNNKSDHERESGGSHDQGEQAKKNQNKVPFLKLFAFADKWDYLLMALGSIGACAHGASVPVFFIFFGKLINIIGIAYLFPTSVSHKVAMVNNII